MPVIPIIGAPNKVSDPVAVRQGGVELVDGFIGSLGEIVRRPGLYPFLLCPDQQPINGVYWWKERSRLIICTNGRIFAMTNMVDASVEITNPDPGLQLSATIPVVFDKDENFLYMVSGGVMLAWSGLTSLTVQDAGAPNTCTHVTYLDGYMICNQPGTNNFYRTNVLTSTPTSPTSPATWNLVGDKKEGCADDIVALKAGWRELLVLGEKTTEVWYNSGDDPPLKRMDGAFIEQGCSAKYSLQNFDSQWIWLNHERRVIMLEGRTPKVLSTPYDNLFRSLGRVDDAISMTFDHFYALAFPSADVSFVYDFRTQGWFTWAKWEPERRGYNRWLGNCAAWVPEWGIQLIGLRRYGIVAIQHSSLMTDCGDLIRMCYRSCHFDHGTLQRKRSNRLMIRMKRGV